MSAWSRDDSGSARPRWRLALACVAALSLGASGCFEPRAKRDLLPEEIALAEFGPEQTAATGAWVLSLAQELGLGAAGEGASASEDPGALARLREQRAPKELRRGRGAAYVALRGQGVLLAEAWGPEGELDESVRVALDDAVSAWRTGAGAGKEGKGSKPAPDTIELDLAHAFHVIEGPTLKNIRAQVSNRNLGIRGLELRMGEEHFERWAPTMMIARNLKVRHGVKHFWKQAGVDEQQFVERGGQARWFEAQQFLVYLDGDGPGPGTSSVAAAESSAGEAAKARRGRARKVERRHWARPGGRAGAGADAGLAANPESAGADASTSRQVTKLFRGNVYVPPNAVSQAATEASAGLMRDWMLHHLHEDGRMSYLWLPSLDVEGDGNNMIRQWMATNALIEIARREDDPELWARVAQNIDYNLEHFYRQEGELGIIQYASTVKLGAMALAALAIINHPERARWQTQEHALRRTIASLWSESGEFTLYYRPRHKRDNAANFYPGETLLLWSQLYAETRDPELLRRYEASYRFYRTWHLDPTNRRPAFVPWHSRASVAMWRALGEEAPTPTDAAGETGEEQTPPPTLDAPEAGPAGGPEAEGEAERTPEGWPVGTAPESPSGLTRAELAEWVFTINDWLIDEMAVWDEALYDDEKGRFYTRKKNYGIPHASATGVFMEGLVDAYVLAGELGDQLHAERYRRTLARALRSVMQLQYVDEVDLYYVVDREAARGGLRTSIFHNDIRVDNVQHVLMGVLDLLEVFGPDDYSTQ